MDLTGDFRGLGGGGFVRDMPMLSIYGISSFILRRGRALPFPDYTQCNYLILQ